MQAQFLTHLFDSLNVTDRFEIGILGLCLLSP